MTCVRLLFRHQVKIRKWLVLLSFQQDQNWSIAEIGVCLSVHWAQPTFFVGWTTCCWVSFQLIWYCLINSITVHLCLTPKGTICFWMWDKGSCDIFWWAGDENGLGSLWLKSFEWLHWPSVSIPITKICFFFFLSFLYLFIYFYLIDEGGNECGLDFCCINSPSL